MRTDRFNLTPVNVTAKKRFSEQAHPRMDRPEAPGLPGAVAAYALVGILVYSRWPDRSCAPKVDDTEEKVPLDTHRHRRDSRPVVVTCRFGTWERVLTRGNAEGERKF